MQKKEKKQEFEVAVQAGYQPRQLVLSAGTPARVTFTRLEGGACSREVVFPTLGIRRELPKGDEVIVDIPGLPAGEHPFTCGMGMLRGTLVVEPAGNS